MWRWVVVGALSIVGGYLVFDGIHALVTGDYVTPSSGEYAGQLGPWSRLVEAVGIDPRSTGFQVTYLAVGAFHLAGAAAVVMQAPSARSWAIAAAVSGLWFLPFGTILDVAALIALFTRAETFRG